MKNQECQDDNLNPIDPEIIALMQFKFCFGPSLQKSNENCDQEIIQNKGGTKSSWAKDNQQSSDMSGTFSASTDYRGKQYASLSQQQYSNKDEEQNRSESMMDEEKPIVEEQSNQQKGAKLNFQNKSGPLYAVSCSNGLTFNKKFKKTEALHFLVLVWQLKTYLESQDCPVKIQKAFYFIFAYFKQILSPFFESRSEVQIYFLNKTQTHKNLESILYELMSQYEVCQNEYETTRLEAARNILSIYIDTMQKANKKNLKDLIEMSKEEIISFQAQPLTFFNNQKCLSRLIDLIYVWERNFDHSSRQETKQGWSYLQNLRFLVVLEQYEEEITQIKYKFFDQFEQFISDKRMDQIYKKYHNLINHHKNAKSGIQYLKNKHQFADWQRKRELQNLKKYENERQIKNQKLSKNKTQQLMQKHASKIKNLFAQIQQEAIQNVNFEIPNSFENLSDLIFFTNEDSKLIPAPQVPIKTWIKMKTATINFNPSIFGSISSSTQNLQKSDKIEEQESGETFQSIMDKFFYGYLQNKMKELQILDELKTLKMMKDEEVSTFQLWTDRQKFLFALFFYIYPEALKIAKKVGFVFTFMSEIIGTKTKEQCQNFWKHTPKNYKTPETFIEHIKTSQALSESQFEEQKKKILWICLKTLIVYQLKENGLHRIANFQSRKDDLIKLMTNPNKYHKKKESMDSKEKSTEESNLKTNKLKNEMEVFLRTVAKVSKYQILNEFKGKDFQIMVVQFIKVMQK